MAIVVEDGTGKTDSESYVSVADADTYHAARGNTTWAAATTANKEIALRKATEYIDLVFAGRWQGWESEADQALSWPRVGVVDFNSDGIDRDEIPTKLKNAEAELALDALTESLLPDVATPAGIRRTKKQVGPIIEEIEYAGSASQVKQRRKADLLLQEYLTDKRRLLRA